MSTRPTGPPQPRLGAWEADRISGLGPLGTPAAPARALPPPRSLAQAPPIGAHDRPRRAGGFSRLELVSLLMGAVVVAAAAGVGAAMLEQSLREAHPASVHSAELDDWAAGFFGGRDE